jgi:hypothetical protein
MYSLLLLGLLVLLGLLSSNACLLVLLGLYPVPQRQQSALCTALLGVQLQSPVAVGKALQQ